MSKPEITETPELVAGATEKITKVVSKATADATKRVRTKHRQLMYRFLASEPVEKICEEMGLSLKNFNTLIDSPLFKSELAGLRKKMREKFLAKSNLTAEDRLRELNPVAIKTLTAIMVDETKKISLALRRAVAKDIIDYNLKLEEQQKKGTLSETAAFFVKAHERAKLRRERERLAQAQAQPAPTPAPAPEAEAEAKVVAN